MNLDGFEKVASEEYQKVNRFLLKLCGDSELAADLTQETFLRAAKSWKSFQGKCSAATWLCSISRHVWADWCKKPPPVPVEANDTIDTVANPEREVEEKEQRFQVYAWLHMLPETEKEVFMLRTFSDLSHQDIGQGGALCLRMLIPVIFPLSTSSAAYPHRIIILIFFETPLR